MKSSASLLTMPSASLPGFIRTHPWPASSQANPGFVTLIQCGDQGMAVVVRCDKGADTGGVFRASPLVAIRIGGLPVISAALTVADHSLHARPTAWPLGSRLNAAIQTRL